MAQNNGGQARPQLSVRASLGNPSNMFQSYSYSQQGPNKQQQPQQAPPNIDLTNTQHGAQQVGPQQHSMQEQQHSKQKASQQTTNIQRLQGLGHSKTPGKPGASRPAGPSAQQSTSSGLPLRGSFSKQNPEERQHAAQQSLQQRQQREKEEQQPAKRQRRVVMESDEESEEDAAAKDKEEAQRRGKSLMLRVEEISEKLRAMLGGGSTNDRYAAVSEDQQAAAAASGGSALVRREQIQAACGTDAASTLKGYQLVGINFLMVLSRSGSAEGAILADEMGLGKTAQTICFLGLLQHMALQQWEQQRQQHQSNPAELRKLRGPKPHLIICPSSLLENWERELKQWCPKLRILTYYGKERSEARMLLENWQTEANAARKNPFARKAAASSANGKSFQGLEGSSEEEEHGAGAGEDEVLEDAEEGSEDEDAAILGFKLPDPASGAAAPFDILLSTYSMFERDSMDAKVDRAFIKKWSWSHLVADEAHALKNSTSIRHQRMMKIAQDCDHRILLTGTPLQNDLGELLALLRFLMPSLFGSNLEMDDEDILGTELLDKAQDEQAQASMADRMRRLLAPFILRRLKSEVAGQLVPKVQEMREVEMVPEQQEVYTKAIQNMRAEVAAARAGKKTDKSSSFEGVDKSLIGVTGPRGKKSGASPDKEASVDQAAEQSAPSTSGTNAGSLVSKLGGTRISNLFTHLRKIALHPLLVRHRYTDEKVQAMAKIATSMQLFGGQCTYDRVLKEMITWSDHALHGFAVNNARHLGSFALPQEALLASAKLKVLSELLPELLAKGNKVLLFSQWTQVLDVLEWFMHRHGFKYVRLDGNTNVQDRLTIVDTFNNPENGVFIFLLSTRAGGQGLNLTGADTVILHDVDFNPQTDKQAEDRCHRLGQERPVTVLRLVTKNTVDRSIVDIAERKLRLDAAIMDGVTLGAKQGDAGDAEGEEAEGKSKAGKGKGKVEGEERKHMGMILAQLLADS